MGDLKLTLLKLEPSEFLKQSGIEEIRVIGRTLTIVHKDPTNSPDTNPKDFETRIIIKKNPYETGKALERKSGSNKLLDTLTVESLIVLITQNWDKIKPEPEEDPTDAEAQPEPELEEPEPFIPKYQFSTFEEWQASVEKSYNKLHKTVDDNIKGAWAAFEFVLSILAILKIEEITLPFIGIILGPPSGVKTLILECLRKDAKGNNRRNTFFTHNFNAHAIISHASALPRKAKEGSQHMLLKMKNNIVLTPELAPMFTRREEELKEILGILTAVADGTGYESDTGVSG